MNKSQFVRHLASKADIQQVVAKRVVDRVFEAMSSALVKGKRIEVRGFGSFVNRRYKAYKGRNPRSGESVQVPAKVQATFRAGRELQQGLLKPRRPKPVNARRF